MLADRLLQALEVLGSDETVGGSLREQASTYLGEPVNDKALTYIANTAGTTYERTLESASQAGYPDAECHLAAICNVLIAGLALGKRLGIEDGESFAREVGNVD